MDYVMYRHYFLELVKRSFDNFRGSYELAPAVSPASIPYHRNRAEITDSHEDLNYPYFVWCPSKIKQPAVKLSLNNCNDKVIPKDLTNDILPLNLRPSQKFLPIIGPKIDHKFNQSQQIEQKNSTQMNYLKSGLTGNDHSKKMPHSVSLSALQGCLVPPENSLQWKKSQLHKQNGRKIYIRLNDTTKNPNKECSIQNKAKVRSQKFTLGKSETLTTHRNPTTVIVSFDNGVNFANQHKRLRQRLKIEIGTTCVCSTDLMISTFS
ncbi:uncharacterized protein TRIADDRAFT_53073 [Trichoplax adhaerens]|uniref:Uncharacterized protein n=1 Tax=Trichoplax adhaerens TaxID=10228 RepID=B3RN82_TRIAD|nr:predicted protein [Trichoplax adhaerens]EDV27976.1 predicted protein [Trichoplax adhaerens]|eukprot:XP_002109810.1 predicted protein [Trichoplax adhaerens]